MFIPEKYKCGILLILYIHVYLCFLVSRQRIVNQGLTAKFTKSVKREVHKVGQKKVHEVFRRKNFVFFSSKLCGLRGHSDFVILRLIAANIQDSRMLCLPATAHFVPGCDNL